MKSEPDVFSFEDLKSRPGSASLWDGVRNYQARNLMRDQMKKGDLVLFYHSSCAEPGVQGLAEVVSEKAVPDPTQFDEASEYFDPKATKEAPRWFCVKIGYREPFRQAVTLAAIKEEAALEDMLVRKRGQRLSVQPVEAVHFRRICEMGGVS
ncbi:MAG: EVE domain-containing protein [Opitutales bacterium]|nr:EVE domain-containing protein [Opitutales bacterium]